MRAGVSGIYPRDGYRLRSGLREEINGTKSLSPAKTERKKTQKGNCRPRKKINGFVFSAVRHVKPFLFFLFWPAMDVWDFWSGVGA